MKKMNHLQTLINHEKNAPGKCRSSSKSKPCSSNLGRPGQQGAAFKDLQAQASGSKRISGDGGDRADGRDVDAVVDGMMLMMMMMMIMMVMMITMI